MMSETRGKDLPRWEANDEASGLEVEANSKPIFPCGVYHHHIYYTVQKNSNQKKTFKTNFQTVIFWGGVTISGDITIIMIIILSHKKMTKSTLFKGSLEVCRIYIYPYVHEKNILQS